MKITTRSAPTIRHNTSDDRSSSDRVSRRLQGPQQGLNQDFQSFQKEHFKWRTDIKLGSDQRAPENEGKPAKQPWWSIVVEAVASTIFGGPSPAFRFGGLIPRAPVPDVLPLENFIERPPVTASAKPEAEEGLQRFQGNEEPDPSAPTLPEGDKGAASPESKTVSILPKSNAAPTTPNGSEFLNTFRSAYTVETASEYLIPEGIYKGLYNINNELHAPINDGFTDAASLYRIRLNADNKFEVVKPGEVSSWNAPLVEQKENGSFRLVSNKLKGGGIGGSKSAPFDPAAYDAPAEGSSSQLKIDQRLKQDAKNFYARARPKPKPVHPPIAKDATPSEVINTVYKKSAGLIVGEDHSESAGLRFLIDGVKDFKANDVKTLYTEGFAHGLQKDLDKFYETGKFSRALNENLDLIDRAHKGHGVYTNRNLLLTMRENGIQVKAIDVPSADSKITRLKTMNYYATKIIEADQATNPEAKWVARVGNEHVFTYDEEPPILGLSELNGATGVSVDDAPANKSTSITHSLDGKEIYIDLKNASKAPSF